ncbi:MAG: DNA-binding protein, partial [Actinomycetota bacterium]|nr:DNA-binding protein [Actinomycetota bacterium]
MSGPTLNDWLRAQDDETLAAVLRARPDLATPRPSDTAVLATRAGTRASVARATEGLDTRTLIVLDALLDAGADRRPVALADVDSDVDPKHVRAAVDTLRLLALAWGDDDALALVPAAREAGGLSPSNLGRLSEALVGVDLRPLLAEIGDDERKLLNTLAQGSPLGRTKDAARVVPLHDAVTPVQRLLARGLLMVRDPETVELPRQVNLALRGDSGVPPLTEPALRTSARRTATVDATAAGESMEVLRHMEILLLLWSDEPAAVLKSGGLG